MKNADANGRIRPIGTSSPNSAGSRARMSDSQIDRMVDLRMNALRVTAAKELTTALSVRRGNS
jgi:hypothetical protein